MHTGLEEATERRSWYQSSEEGSTWRFSGS